MAGRGRKSAEELSAPLLPGTWPEPPDDLAEPEADIWLAITRSLPSDWFSPPNFALLKQYCRHAHSCDLISADIAQWRGELVQVDERLRQEAVGRAERLKIQIQKIVRQQMTAHGSQSDHVARLGPPPRCGSVRRSPPPAP
jgi:hypothetical protein